MKKVIIILALGFAAYAASVAFTATTGKPAAFAAKCNGCN